jgi:hypothetical protein
VSQQSLLTHVLETLDQVGIAYFITGSTVSSIQGEPRSTHDIDLVVALEESAASALVASFPEPDFHVSADAVRDAIEARSMFNVLDLTSGDKVDFWLLTDEPFDVSRFGRRQQIDLFGLGVFVSTPEDTILQKLLWSRLSGGSDRQERDALAVYELQFARLDQPYLDTWADSLQVRPILDDLRSRAEPLE